METNTDPKEIMAAAEIRDHCLEALKTATWGRHIWYSVYNRVTETVVIIGTEFSTHTNYVEIWFKKRKG